ncbi:MAG TPA: carbon storage regulator [Pirellulales bacterium]|nr:carbon storage regulator [Pirellulales bacterium]
MLVLTRKTQQQIQIGDNIRITVLQIKGSSVRIGIEAPRDLNIARGELKAIAAQTAGAVNSEPSRPGRRLAELRQRNTTTVEGFSSPEEGTAAEALATAEHHLLDGPAVISHPVFVAAHAAADMPSWPDREPRLERRASEKHNAAHDTTTHRRRRFQDSAR